MANIHNPNPGTASSASVSAESTRAAAAEALIAAQAQALSHVYASTTAAQADGTLANGSFYTVANTTTGQLDLYSKTDASNSVFKFSLAQATQTNLNTTALAVLNETVATTTFATEPPAGSDPWVDIWTSISNPGIRWTTSIVGGALQIVQTQASVLLRGLVRKDQQVAAGLWLYAEMTPATVATQTSIGLLVAPDAAGGGILDATHGHALIWRQDGGLQLYRGDGTTAVASSVPNGTPSVTFLAGQTVGLGMLVGADDPTKATVVQVVNGKIVGSFVLSNLPTTGYVGAIVKNASNPITATISKLQFHQTIKKGRYLYVNGAGAGSLGTEASPFTTIEAGLVSAVEKPGERLELVIKAGTYRLLAGISIPTNKYREVTIRCPSTEQAIIKGSTLLSSGTAQWTATSGTSHVWQHSYARVGSKVAMIDTSHTVDLGAVVDPLASQSPTPRGGIIAPYRTYKNIGDVGGAATVTTQKALCDATAGSTFVDATTGIVYVHPVGDVDANTLNWERCDAANVLNIPWAATTDMNACRVNLANLRFFGSYSQQVQIQRAWVDIENCVSEWCGLADGWSLDACHGLVASCLAQYNYNDGFHSNPIDTASVVAKPILTFLDCLAQGQFVGDGWSNHELTEHVGLACRSLYNGKAGLAMNDRFRFHDARLVGNTQYAITLGGQSVVQNIEASLWNPVIDMSPIAIQVGSAIAGDVRALTVRGGRLSNTAGHSGVTCRRNTIDVANDPGATASITLYNVRDGGNNAADRSTGGTITYLNDAGYLS